MQTIQRQTIDIVILQKGFFENTRKLLKTK